MTSVAAADRTLRFGATEVRTMARVEARLGERLWEIYQTAFEPLRVLAAARQVMSRSEFGSALDDPRIDFLVAYQGDEPMGLATLTTDLTAVPWISPEYYAARYPDEAARGAVFYVPYACTDTSRPRPGVLWALTRAVCAPVVQAHGVLAYDICASNNASLDFARKMEVWYRRIGAQHVEHIDSQHYYAAHYGGIANHGRTFDDPRDRRS